MHPFHCLKTRRLFYFRSINYSYRRLFFVSRTLAVLLRLVTSSFKMTHTLFFGTSYPSFSNNLKGPSTRLLTLRFSNLYHPFKNSCPRSPLAFSVSSKKRSTVRTALSCVAGLSTKMSLFLFLLVSRLKENI